MKGTGLFLICPNSSLYEYMKAYGQIWLSECSNPCYAPHVKIRAGRAEQAQVDVATWTRYNKLSLFMLIGGQK